MQGTWRKKDLRPLHNGSNWVILWSTLEIQGWSNAIAIGSIFHLVRTIICFDDNTWKDSFKEFHQILINKDVIMRMNKILLKGETLIGKTWKKQGRLHGKRCVLAGTDSSFGQKRHFSMVSTRVWRTYGWTDGWTDGRTDGQTLL